MSHKLLKRYIRSPWFSFHEERGTTDLQCYTTTTSVCPNADSKSSHTKMPSSAKRDTNQERALYRACSVASNHLFEHNLIKPALMVLSFFKTFLDVDEDKLWRLTTRTLGDIHMEARPDKSSESCDVASDWVAHAATVLSAAGRNEEAHQARDLAQDLKKLSKLYLEHSAQDRT